MFNNEYKHESIFIANHPQIYTVHILAMMPVGRSPYVGGLCHCLFVCCSDARHGHRITTLPHPRVECDTVYYWHNIDSVFVRVHSVFGSFIKRQARVQHRIHHTAKNLHATHNGCAITHSGRRVTIHHIDAPCLFRRQLL